MGEWWVGYVCDWWDGYVVVGEWWVGYVCGSGWEHTKTCIQEHTKNRVRHILGG